LTKKIVTMPSGKLTDWRILLVEDEYYIADDLRRALGNEGAMILGPFASVDPASAAARAAELDCAVLDLNLQGELSFALYEELAARGVPLVVVSGYDRTSIPPQFAGITLLSKPVDTDRLVQCVAEKLR
jgi:DNA-binding NtrC family response regulator